MSGKFHYISDGSTTSREKYHIKHDHHFSCDKSGKTLPNAKTDRDVMEQDLLEVSNTSFLQNLEENQTYYAVFIPIDASVKSDKDAPHVYTEKGDALKVMKQFKKARLKQFKTKKEALSFVRHGAENVHQANTLQCITVGEKVLPFKCPKVQDMISFKKAIESGDFEDVKKKIVDNPRYLVSNGDTPSILQEGSRYNALHIAAKSKNLEIARLILDSITDLDFISYLYDDNDLASCKTRIEVLLDLYLNMPDKGLNETPLHIAVKFGAIEMVEYLISFPQCQRNLINKFHQQPKDIVCSRVNNPCEETKKAITALLEEQFYIPVLRSADNSIQPRVGEPFSPSKPLNLSEDLLSPRIEIQAYAGPMNKENVECFQRKWKFPQRSVKNLFQPTLKLRDLEKGLEKIGRNIASELRVPWREYWPFLDTFVNLASDEGLQLLENYLKKRFEETLNLVRIDNSSDKLISSDKAISPISALCEAMRWCSLSEESSTPVKKLKWSSLMLEKHEIHKRTDDNNENDGKNPLLYVERSCEVFGKRIASALSSSADIYGAYSDTVKDSLEVQVKHLMSNILSYREDYRFQAINFQMIHSRVAAVAVHSFEDSTDRDRQSMLSGLKSIDWTDGTLSDDEDLNDYRTSNQVVTGNTIKQHLHCLVKNLIAEFSDYSKNCDSIGRTARNEADCSLMWALASPCSCSWTVNNYSRPRIGIKRKSSKFPKNDFDCDNRSRNSATLALDYSDQDAERAILFKFDEEDDEVFRTPPSGPSDSDGETMEDPLNLPDTFIYEGDEPSKADYAVLEAIDTSIIPSDKYPSISLWKHLVALHAKSKPPSSKIDRSSGSPTPKKSDLNVTFGSSPGTPLNKSVGTPNSSRCSGSVQPWERILGPYSPRSNKRTPSFFVRNQDSLLCNR